MLKQFLRSLYERILADSESESGPDGYLSHRAEWHSAAWGFGAMFVAVLTGNLMVGWAAIGWTITRAADRTVPGFVPYPKQLASESSYVLGHGVAGAVVAIGARGLLAVFGVDVPVLPF